MPFLYIIVPQLSADSKDSFLAAWPQVAAALKAHPTILGLSAGPIVATDEGATTDFQFLQCLAFKTIEDHTAFVESDLVKDSIARYEAKATGPAFTTLFEVAEFPTGERKADNYTQISRITMDDESKAQEAREIWKALGAELGKETWGGASVGEWPKLGLAFIAWDSLEEAGKAYSAPKAAELLEKYKSIGKQESAMVKMEVY